MGIRLSVDLVHSVVRAAAKAAGLPPLTLAQASVRWPLHLCVANIGFSGARTGALRVFAPPESLASLAASVIHLSADDPQAHALGESTLAELSNVFLGALLANWMAGNAPYQIGLPELQCVPSVELPPRGTHDQGCFLVYVDAAGQCLGVDVSVRSPDSPTRAWPKLELEPERHSAPTARR
jgi:hypothetical protein